VADETPPGLGADATCPRCGSSLADRLDGVAVATDAGDDSVRVPVDCHDCDAPLTLVVESALPDALGVDVYVKDRRE